MQSSFTTPNNRVLEILERCGEFYASKADGCTLTVSGGTDSVVAADLTCRHGPKYGIEPDSITHINTGAGVPQSKLVAKILADIHDLKFIEQGYRKRSDSLAYRVLEHGWPGGYAGSPATGGHGLEWANRKDKPMSEVYMQFDGLVIWVSGVRKHESSKRKGNVPDSGIEQDRPRRVWLSPIAGWTSEEKQAYIKDRGLPVSEAYLILGFSGECTACSFDEPGLLTDLDILCPELSFCIRTLTVWLYMRIRKGDVDIEPKRLCWGWEPDEEPEVDYNNEYDTFKIPPDGVENPAKIHVPYTTDTAQEMVGCDEEGCSAKERKPWIADLPDEQLVTRGDVKDYWETGNVPQRFPV